MRKKLIIAPMVLSLLLSFQTFSYGEEKNASKGSDNAAASSENKRQLNVGNYREIESGMEPVVYQPSHVEGRTSNGLSNPLRGLYTTGITDTTPITYTIGAPVMNTPKVYLIWYGSWKTTPVAPASAPVSKDYSNFMLKLLKDLAGSTRWSNIIQPYYSKINSIKKNIGALAASTTANQVFIPTNTATYGSSLSQSSILKIAKAGFPTVDANGVYLVLTSADISVPGFNAGTIQFCGWHSFEQASGRKYGFVGDSANATWCQPQTTSQNGAGPDAVASVLVHEIEEAVTDPQLNAWWSSQSNGSENADKCAWSWGLTNTTSNTVNASNYSWGSTSTNYLIQQEFKLGTITPLAIKNNRTGVTTNYDSATGTCALN